MHFIELLPLALLDATQTAGDIGIDTFLGIIKQSPLAVAVYLVFNRLLNRVDKDSDRQHAAHDALETKVDAVHGDVKEVKTLVQAGSGCRITNPQKAGV